VTNPAKFTRQLRVDCGAMAPQSHQHSPGGG
jgi:hypothetical protein